MSNASSTTSPPQLSVDILHKIAQKMLFTKPADQPSCHCEIDLRRRNGFTSFMAVNPTTRNVFLSQFVKMKHIEFKAWDPHIKMFRENKNGQKSGSTDQTNKAFAGPYLVTKAFVGVLIDFGKLNLSSLRTSRYFDEKNVCASKKPCNFAIQSFCKMFLNKEISDEDASAIRFELDELNIWERNDVLSSVFEELLNLDAKKVKISHIDSKVFNCSLFTRTAVAKRTQKFSLELRSFYCDDAELDDLKSNWQELLDVLLSVCPEIREIEFTIFYELEDAVAIKEFVTHFGEMVDMFVQQIFPNLSEGSSSAQIKVLLEANCDTDHYKELLTNGDELFKKGHEIEVKQLDSVEAHKARECQTADKLSRTHKCEFRVLAHEDSPGSEAYDYNYSFHDSDSDYDHDHYDYPFDDIDSPFDHTYAYD